MNSNIVTLFGEPFEKPASPTPRPRRSAFTWKFILVIFAAGALTALAIRYWPMEVRGQQDDPEANYEKGKNYFDPGQPAERWPDGAALIRSAAEQGYVKAETAMGLLYSTGAGVTQDSAAAAEWFRKAALQGCAIAQNELGLLLAKGIGTEKNVPEALQWLTKAAEQNSEIARKNLILVRLSLANTLPTLKTLSGEVYCNVEIKKVEADGITATFDGEKGGLCMAKLPVAQLPEDLQALCRAAQRPTLTKGAMTRLGQFARM